MLSALQSYFLSYSPSRLWHFFYLRTIPSSKNVISSDWRYSGTSGTTSAVNVIWKVKTDENLKNPKKNYANNETKHPTYFHPSIHPSINYNLYSSDYVLRSNKTTLSYFFLKTISFENPEFCIMLNENFNVVFVADACGSCGVACFFVNMPTLDLFLLSFSCILTIYNKFTEIFSLIFSYLYTKILFHLVLLCLLPFSWW